MLRRKQTSKNSSFSNVILNIRNYTSKSYSPQHMINSANHHAETNTNYARYAPELTSQVFILTLLSIFYVGTGDELKIKFY